jgi:hypothetical protein
MFAIPGGFAHCHYHPDLYVTGCPVRGKITRTGLESDYLLTGRYVKKQGIRWSAGAIAAIRWGIV